MINPYEHRFDFTEKHYRELLRLTKAEYRFVFYNEFRSSERIVLWRHDLDHSIHRALRLAQIEAEEGVKTTYFVHLHNNYYNWWKRDIADKLKEIQAMGHQLGLHFDPAFYQGRMNNGKDIIRRLAWEKQVLEMEFNQKIEVFSFHNPEVVGNWLNYESDRVAGMINTYGRTLKTNFTYCSDSNGYWRFERLWDVLNKAAADRLQVLTHPGWWQERPMHPRERVFRNIYGQAESTMRLYDTNLASVGRTNLVGPSEALSFLKPLNSQLFELCDYLWNQRRFQTLFVELGQLHERQLNLLCKATLLKKWHVPLAEINAFFEEHKLTVDAWRLFTTVFEVSWQTVTGMTEEDQKAWANTWNQLIHGRGFIDPEKLEDGCVYLCGVIEKVGNWGMAETGINYDGIVPLKNIGIPADETIDDNLSEKLKEESGGILDLLENRWRKFKTTQINTDKG